MYFKRTKEGHKPQVGLFWGLAAGAVLGLSLVLLLRVQAAPACREPAQVVEYKEIGLPSVGTMALQYINQLGLLEPTSTTIQILASNGTPLGYVTEPAIPAESVFIYSAPESFDDLARVEYERVLEGGNLVFGVNYDLLPGGSAAYLGLDLAQPFFSLTQGASPSQPALYELQVMLQMKQYWDWSSAFTLQNRRVDNSANVAIYFFDTMGGEVCSYPLEEIPAGGSLSIALDSVDCLPDGFYGTAVVFSDQPVAVSSVYNYNSTAGLLCAYQGIGSEQTATNWVAPALFNEHELQTSTMCVVNAQDSDTAVAVKYSDGITSDAVLMPRASWCLVQSSEGHSAGWTGGATIEASQPVAAVVQVQAYEGETAVGCWAYTATPLESTARIAGDTLAFPLVAKQMNGWVSDIYLYNPYPQAVQVTPRYVSYPSGFVYCPEQITLGPGEARSFSQQDLPGGFGQAMAYFVTSQEVGGAVRFTNSQLRSPGDQHFGYGAAHTGSMVPLPDTCGSVSRIFLPLLVRE